MLAGVILNLLSGEAQHINGFKIILGGVYCLGYEISKDICSRINFAIQEIKIKIKNKRSKIKDEI